MFKSIYFSLVCLFFSGLVNASPVNINTADADQIAQALKGVGPSKAAAIVEFRSVYGPFAQKDDLIKVKGIGQKTLESNKDDIIIVSDN